MTESGQTLRRFYEAAQRRDLAEARRCLADDLVFVGLFETYPNADAYMSTFTGLLSITRRLEIKTIIADGEQAAIFFELETGPPAEATVLVAEWHRFRDGKIYRVNSAFDARPYEAMFTARSAEHG